MIVITKPKEMTRAARRERTLLRQVGLVPTLGYLHEGHEALIKRAKKENGLVVVSQFVNPLQFRAKAYRDYPRDFDRDMTVCERLGVDYLFSPEAEDMYPEGFDTSVEVKDMAGRLEGASIRWHYRAVTTVVAKLFNIVQPDTAYFGRKDPHQLAIIKRMAEDLNFPVKIISVETRRAKDGLALSSRNSLLSGEERKAAAVISKAQKAIETRIKRGEKNWRKLASGLAAMIEKEPLAEVDYAAVVDADTLRDEVTSDSVLIYSAVYIGGKRLTDNRVVKIPSGARSGRRA